MRSRRRYRTSIPLSSTLLIAALSGLLACHPGGSGAGGTATDGGSSDGGWSDGARTDGATTDGATTDGATTDGATTDTGGTSADDTGSKTGACNEENEDCTADSCEGKGEQMLPGARCLRCHGDTKVVDKDAIFSAAGTAYVDADGSAPLVGATVRISDATGLEEALITSKAGNFYTTAALTLPIHVSLETKSGSWTMASEMWTGDCNSCHRCSGPGTAKLAPTPG